MPLNSHETTADVAGLLGLPVVLVVGVRLGCLNHALLTAQAISARGLKLAGWVSNQIDAAMPAARENIAALAERLAAPLLATLRSSPRRTSGSCRAARFDWFKLKVCALREPARAPAQT